MDTKIWMISLIIMFAVHPICIKASIYKMASVSPGGWINIKMPSYQYRKSHCEDKMILRPSYLHNGTSYTGNMISLYSIGALAAVILCQTALCCGAYHHQPFPTALHNFNLELGIFCSMFFEHNALSEIYPYTRLISEAPFTNMDQLLSQHV